MDGRPLDDDLYWLLGTGGPPPALPRAVIILNPRLLSDNLIDTKHC